MLEVLRRVRRTLPPQVFQTRPNLGDVRPHRHDDVVRHFSHTFSDIYQAGNRTNETLPRGHLTEYHKDPEPGAELRGQTTALTYETLRLFL